MALLELTLQATYFNQEIINRWNYVSTGTPASVTLSFALASAFGCIYDTVAVPPGYPANTPFAAIRGIQMNSLAYDQVSVRDVYSDVDFYETPFLQAAAGLVGSGEAMSPTSAAGYRTSRIRADIRRGTKRFAGLSEANVGPGGVFAAAALTAMALVATRMGEVLSYNDEGNTITFTPVIVGKEKYVPNPANPDKFAYRYYPTLAEQEDHWAAGISWDYYTQVRTQTSRQYGRGR